jgi:hypothetical protein
MKSTDIARTTYAAVYNRSKEKKVMLAKLIKPWYRKYSKSSPTFSLTN